MTGKIVLDEKKKRNNFNSKLAQSVTFGFLSLCICQISNGAPVKHAQCLDCAFKKHDKMKPIGLWPCHGQGGNQVSCFSSSGQERFYAQWWQNTIVR